MRIQRIIANMTKSNQQQQQSHYEVLETLPKLNITTFYVKSVFIGLWVLLKWLVFLVWSNLVYSRSNNKKTSSSSSPSSAAEYNDGYHHDKPPSILVDNKIGRHSYVKLKNVKLHYVEAGKPNNPLILLLHGFPDCWLGWRNQIQELSRFFRVIALDMKGFNDSDKPIWRQVYTPKKICDELRQFIYSLGCNSATIMGHDIGAVIGWFFVHTNPNNIDRFICVSAAHPNIIWDNLHPKAVVNDSWLQFIQMPLLPELDHSSTHSKFIEKSLESVQCLETSTKNSKAVVKSVKRSSTITSSTIPTMNGSNDEYYDDLDSNFNVIDTYKYVFNRRADWTGPFNYYRNFPFYRIKDGSSVRCPVLIVTGNQDEICRLESVVKSTDYCDSFVVKIIDGAGHWPHQQIPSEFNKVILSFLVGRRAQLEHQQQVEKNSRIGNSGGGGLVGLLSGAVSHSVKIGTSVLDSVQQRTNNLRSSIHVTSPGNGGGNNNDSGGGGGGSSIEENDPFF